MILECGNGKVFQNIDAETLSAELEKLDEDNPFVTLSSDWGFFQAAITDSGFLAEYRDPGGYFCSREADIPREDIKKAFLAYLNGGDDWRTVCSWNKQQEDETAGPREKGRTAGIPRPENLVDGLIGSVKRDLKSAAKKKLNRFLKF